MNRLPERVLEQPAVYRWWRAWHAGQKFGPVLAHNELSRVRRRPGVGCGSGTNTPRRAHADYSGVDISPACITELRHRYRRLAVLEVGWLGMIYSKRVAKR